MLALRLARVELREQLAQIARGHQLEGYPVVDLLKEGFDPLDYLRN